MAEEQLRIDGVGPEKPPRQGRQGKRGGSPPVDRAKDPLTPDQAKSLLASSSVIRDPVHHDIRVTKFELSLIDSEAFQRLRLVNQLAMVDLVYPGAVHTRFLHSLGTLHVCGELVRACNNSVKALRPSAPLGDPLPVRIGFYAEFLARLVALLHDMAHVPFGHVFEREAQIFDKDEWEDPWRLEQTLGPGSTFAGIFRRALVDHLTRLSAGEAMAPAEAEVAAEQVLTEVRETITAKGVGVLRLRYPFIADLVGNTICADLLDYVQRDMYFCGLTEGLAKRFLSYLAVIPVRYVLPNPDQDSDAAVPSLKPVRDDMGAESAQPLLLDGDSAVACRVVFLYYRYNHRKAANTKENVLSEAIDLVRTRKLVAEKLYFHKTKLTATSMLAAAAHASGMKSAQLIWDKSDHEVLELIRDGADSPPSPMSDKVQRRRARAKKIAEDLLARRIFKPIFRLSWHPDMDDPAGLRLWHPRSGVYARFNTPAGREELIELIEQAIEENLLGTSLAGAGAASVSCPNKNMQLKPFEMLVLANPSASEIGPLEGTVRPIVREEIDIIKRQHEELWRLEVFVDSQVVDLSTAFALRLAGAIQHFVGMNNELTEYRTAPVSPIQDLIREGKIEAELKRLGLADKITKVHHTQLVRGDIAARGSAAIETQLRDWGYLG